MGPVGLRFHWPERDRGDIVFLVYLTKRVSADLPGSTSPASWLGHASAVAGLTVAVLAPVSGVWVGRPHGGDAWHWRC